MFRFQGTRLQSSRKRNCLAKFSLTSRWKSRRPTRITTSNGRNKISLRERRNIIWKFINTKKHWLWNKHTSLRWKKQSFLMLKPLLLWIGIKRKGFITINKNKSLRVQKLTTERSLTGKIRSIFQPHS